MAKSENIKKKEESNVSEAFEYYMLNKLMKVSLSDSAKKILSYWQDDFEKSLDRHINFLKENAENQDIYNSKISEILQNMKSSNPKKKTKRKNRKKMSKITIIQKMIKKQIVENPRKEKRKTVLMKELIVLTK